MSIFHTLTLMGTPISGPEALARIRAGYLSPLPSRFDSFINQLSISSKLADHLPKRYDPLCKQNLQIIRQLWRRFLVSLHGISSMKSKSLAEVEHWYVQTQLTAHFPSTISKSKLKTIEDYWVFAHTHALIPPLDIRPVPDKGGWGLFAREDIPPFSYLGIYAGDVTPQHWGTSGNDEGESLLSQFHLEGAMNGYVMHIEGTELYIDAEEHGNHTRFINCCDLPEETDYSSSEFLLDLVLNGKVNCILLFTSLKESFNGYFWTTYRIRKDDELLIWYGADHQQLYR